MKTQQFKSFLAAVCLFLAACSGSKSASKAEEAYSSASAAGDAVYVDVVSFAPVSGIYDESEKMHINKNYSDIVAEAFTSDGDLIHVMFTVDEYKKEIDPDLDLSNVIVSNVMGSYNTIYYSPARRIHGTVITADSVTDNLSETTGDLLIECSSLDAVGEAGEAQLFTEDIKGGEPVYADLIGIMPYYTISSNNLGAYNGFVCYTEDENENVYWVYVDTADYVKYFDENAQTSQYDVAKTLDTVMFDSVKRIKGSVVFSDSYSVGLSEEIPAKIIRFESVE